MVMMPLMLIPLVGLAIDGTRVFIVQAKLSSAVDGAALGAGRLLGTQANTTEIANEFLTTNFPTGIWGTTNLTPTITATDDLGTHTISISATARVPLTFMRIFGQQTAVAAASATATRRDTRIVLVLDRSGSMDTTDPVSHQNVFTVLKGAAKTFVGRFNPGHDQLGLVVFAGSAIVAYPVETAPYSTDPTGTGGPDTSFATSSTAGPVYTQINALNASGGTGMTEALTLAYIELQKAHYRDTRGGNVDNAMNAIVLFTDGVPNSIAVSPNDNSNLPNSNVLLPSGTHSYQSPCKYNPATSDASTHMRGYMVALGDPHAGWGDDLGLYLLSAYDTGHTLTWWLGHASSDQTTSNPSNAITSCRGLNYGGDDDISTDTDLAKIPPQDIYGNSTGGTAYQWGRLSYNGGTPYAQNTTTFDSTNLDDGYHLAAAAWNATDYIGNVIRAQTAMNPIRIYTIGYDGDGGTDVALLQKLANRASDTNPAPVVTSQPVGDYRLCHTATDINGAFADIASGLLRLAQ